MGVVVGVVVVARAVGRTGNAHPVLPRSSTQRLLTPSPSLLLHHRHHHFNHHHTLSWLLWIPSLVISVVDMRRGEGITGGGKRYPVGTPA